MHAAVVRSFEHPPRFEEFPLPGPRGSSEVVVDVLAAGLHPRVRTGASGKHYADLNTLPMVPGIDGVGRLPDGRRVYFVLHDTPMGSMAEQTLADLRRCVPLPDGVDEALVAAAMNPAMSSWLALRLRAPLKKGSKVLVLGASGNAGTLAVQIARRLGAGQVIGAGRNVERLRASRADAIVLLSDDPAALADNAPDVDVVLDYLWGEPAERAMMAILRAREDRSKPLDWIQIGAVAGPDLTLPSVVLRSANLRVLGSGQGSLSLQAIVEELPELVAEIVAGHLGEVEISRVPLADVEAAFVKPDPAGRRVVLVPTTGA